MIRKMEVGYVWYRKDVAVFHRPDGVFVYTDEDGIKACLALAFTDGLDETSDWSTSALRRTEQSPNQTN